MIPYSCQTIDDDDIAAVTDALQSSRLTQGPIVHEFEQAIAAYTESNYAVAVSSATAALHIACLALELGPNDWLWTSGMSFSASANCGLYCGAKVDFVDIDIASGNLSIGALESKLAKAKQAGCLPKIVVVVHYAGQSCDMKAVALLSKQYGFKIIEDSAQAFGGYYAKKKVGGCQFSDMAVFSFHPTKTITTAEGGVITCNDRILYDRLNCFKSHGLVFSEAMQSQEGGWYRDQAMLGFNYRMSELHAALGLSQISKCDQFIEARHLRALRYNELFKDVPQLSPLEISKYSKSAWHLYVLLLDESLPSHSRRALYEFMHQNGIGTQVHYIPIFKHSFFQQKGIEADDFPNTMSFYQRCLSIPLYPTLSSDQQTLVVDTIKAFFDEQVTRASA